MKTTQKTTLVLTTVAAALLPAIQNPADASPGVGDRSPTSKRELAHSEQGNFGIVGGGGAGSGLEREFGSGSGGGGLSLSEGDCPADWDGDGFLTSTDVAFYFNDYVIDLNDGTLYADFNTDEITNSSDAVQYINAWFIGCW